MLTVCSRYIRCSLQCMQPCSVWHSSASFLSTMSDQPLAAAQHQQQPAASRPLVVEEADNPIQPDHYVYIDHLRLVKPYFFDFKCFVKKRWEGKRLVELFTEEFPLLTHEYYSRAFAAGRLRVESSSGAPLKKAMSLDSRLAGGMCVRHLVHRHEPPVLAGEVKVLQVTSDWVVVVKPACMPVHTVGQYRKNTVLGVLQAEHPHLGNLHPTYRLDKPVSGLLVLARSSDAAGRVRKLLEDRTCDKAYVARVQGLFPSTPEELGTLPKAGDQHVRVISGTSSSTQGSTAQPDTAETATQGQGSTSHVTLEVDVPLTWSAKTNHATALPINHQPADGGGMSAGDAKPAITHFRLVGRCEDGTTSLVECKPLTGRTHQIRVHLQYLGFPIANDTQYGGLAGKPLPFKRLHQAVAEQKSREHGSGGLQAPQHSAHSAPQPAAVNSTVLPGTDAAGEPCSKRMKSDEGDVMTAGSQPEGQQGAVQDEQHSAHAKRSDLITAFAHGGSQFGMIHPGAHGQGQHTLSNAQQGNDTVTQGAEVNNSGGSGSGSGRGGSGGQQGLIPEAKVGLLHQVISRTGVGSCCAALPEEIDRLYRDPRFRVPADQEEEVCPHCPCMVPQGYPIDLEPIWLHAIRYSCSEWAFEAPLPEWAALGQPAS